MKDIVDRFRRYFVHVGVMSFAIDMLMLTPVFFMLAVFDKVITSRSNETLIVLGLIALYAVAVMSLLDSLRTRLLSRFGATLRQDLAPRMLTLNLQTTQQPENAKHALEDVSVLERFLTGSGIKAFFEAPWIPIMVGLLYLFHPVLAATAMVLMTLLIILTVLEERLTANHREKATDANRRAAYFGNFARQNIQSVSALGMQTAVTERWSRYNDEYLDHEGRANRISATIEGLAKFVRVSGQMLGLVVGAWLLLNSQDVTPGVMVASLLLMGRTLGPMDHVINNWKGFVGARRAYARLKGLIDDMEAHRLPVVDLPRPLGQLTIERAQLWAGPAQRMLGAVNLKLQAGESMGVIGPSGSGKSTLARLIVGLVKPTQGHVRLDGAEVSQWAQSELGRYVGYLPQDVVLFPGTIAENIARLQDPVVHNDAIIAAAKKARIHTMILAFPKGYETEVGEGGSRLSGGQRQLVGLARALFGSPSLVVMDEPNASLDSAAEQALMEIIRNLRISRVTVVIIAHKPSIIRDLDKLLVLRDGDQVMFGNTADVMRNMQQPANGTQPAIGDESRGPKRIGTDDKNDNGAAQA